MTDAAVQPVQPDPAPPDVARDDEFGGQYGIGILVIWAAAAAPMGLVMWWVVPALVVPTSDFPGLVTWLLLTCGLVWQTALALFVLFREVRPFTCVAVRRRLWLTTPRGPRTGRPSRKLLWWGLPIAAASIALFEVTGVLDTWFVRAFPAVAAPEHGQIENLADPRLVGQWWLLGVLVAALAGNYVLGEELIFRGILLPKVHGVFGRWDVPANGVLFGLYHVHLLWTLPSQVLTGWIYGWAMKRYRSYWVSVIVHGVEGVVLVVALRWSSPECSGDDRGAGSDTHPPHGLRPLRPRRGRPYQRSPRSSGGTSAGTRSPGDGARAGSSARPLT